SFDILNLDVRRSLRHHDDGSHPEMFCRQRHTLRMVSCARCDDTNGPLRLRKPCDPVVRASDLETEDRLLILTLQPDTVSDAFRQPGRRIEPSFSRNLIAAACKNRT